MADSTRQSLGERISSAVTPNLFKSDGTIAKEQTRGSLDQAQAKLEPESEKSYIQKAADSLRGLTSTLHLPHQFTTDTPLSGELLMPDDDDDDDNDQAMATATHSTESVTERISHKAAPLAKGDSKLWDAVSGEPSGTHTNTSITPGDTLPTSVTAAQGLQDHGLLERAAHMLGFGSGGDQASRK